jgi:hypothetical protein
MPYNYELEMSADISVKVIEEMISNLVAEQTGKTVDKIEHVYDQNNDLTGMKVFFQSEQAELVSNSADQLKKPKIIDKKWKPFVWD